MTNHNETIAKKNLDYIDKRSNLIYQSKMVITTFSDQEI